MGGRGKGAWLLGCALVACSGSFGASAAAEPTPAEKKARYALPFAMRPAVAPNLVRLDDGVALRDGERIETNILTTGYKFFSSLPDLGLYARVATVYREVEGGKAGFVASNPLAFALYTPEIAPKVRLPLFLGLGIPVGEGGGNVPNKTARATITSGAYARQAMDNALFAPNYLTTALGAGLGWIDKGFTAQVEATVFLLRRTRGEAIDGDRARTNFTSGVNLGWQAIAPWLSVNAEAHYQRWITTPLPVQKDPTLRDQLTAGVGLRANLPLDENAIARPGIGVFLGLDDPMTKQHYRIVQVDLPIAF